jgi:DNA polymerase I-like protein with 3'-5' exonuclease and polymerase domains
MKATKFQLYAFSSYGLDITLEEAEHSRNVWMDTYTGIRDKINEITKRFYKEDLIVRTPMGLPVKPKLYTDALNIPIQGAVAEISKLWIHYMWKEHNKGVSDAAAQMLPIANFVHDSITLESPEEDAKYWEELLSWSQQKAWEEYCKLPDIKIKDIPMVAEVGVSKSYQGAS